MTIASATPPRPADNSVQNPLEDHLGYLLRRAQLAVFQHFQDCVQGLDMTPAAYSTLVIVAHNPGIRQNVLTEMLAIKPANCVPLVNGLERRGLLLRTKVKVSGRAVALSLTDQGQAFLDQADGAVQKHLAVVRQRLGATNESKLLELLRPLAAGLPQTP
jgi:DNA-binding MarR family transcriptional regulator